MFWALLRGATAHLPIRDVTARGSAVAAVAATDVSAVPLTCLRLELLDPQSEDHAVGVVAALAAHGPGLQELHLKSCNFDGPDSTDAEYHMAGFALTVVRDVPAMPALRKLVLCVPLCVKAARRLAAACPAVETLILDEDCGWLTADTGVCWQLPGAFPLLQSLSWESSWDNPAAGTLADLLPTLWGRSLERLSSSPCLNRYVKRLGAGPATIGRPHQCRLAAGGPHAECHGHVDGRAPQCTP